MASLVIRPLVVAVLVLMPFSATAQDPSSPAGESSQQQLLKPEELDALVAPIALYPDTLLAEVLMASVYPIEVVQADAWRRRRSARRKSAVAWRSSSRRLARTGWGM